MTKKNCFDIGQTNILVVYKHSRFSYAKEQASHHEQSTMFDKNNPITKNLFLAHQKNLQCIDHVISVLNNFGLTHTVICRSDLTKELAQDSFIISVGGDGTLLDVSHYCTNSPILGVNSDPDSSIGALCAAHAGNFEQVLQEIYRQTLKPIGLLRLAISIDGKSLDILPLNDVLFCHKNPAAMARFAMSFQGTTEIHRGSGVWVATPAGSTGGIFSSGANPLPLEQKNAIFRVREPSLSGNSRPTLLHGTLGSKDKLLIRCHMSDAAIFIDGPHKTWDVAMGQTVLVSLCDQPLWLFDGKRLEQNRHKIIEQRLSIKDLL
jgi:NAD+ kinase